MAAPWILLTMLGQAVNEVAPQPPATPWQVVGIDAEWTLALTDELIVLTRKGRPPLTLKAVKPTLGELGWVWKARGLTIESMPVGCEEKKTGHRYPDAVTVTIGRSYLNGCGGVKLVPDDLSGTSWEIVEIAGGRAGGANYAIDFVAGSFLAYDGCNRVQGTYRQAGGKLMMKPQRSTASRCGPIAGPCAVRFWKILEEPVSTTFLARKQLVLAGRTGIIRLQEPDEKKLFDPPKPTACAAPPG